KGTLTGGKMNAEGEVFCKGTPRGHSGGLQHPAHLRQEASYVDLYAVIVRPELIALYEEITGLPYVAPGEKKEAAKETEKTAEIQEGDGVMLELSLLATEADIREKSIAFCNVVRERGYRILWDPLWSVVREEED
ncbi:MAG: hypothetical protein IJP92_13455, partial [Lachnospiraceae bacterium]|nr:hypothetical protein [Lachnospiraceae bacterium]